MPLLLLLAAWPSAAQSPDADAVRWAVSVDGFSTAFGRKAYGPGQVLGPPEAWPRTGESPVAWAPSRAGGSRDEWLRVSFAEPAPVRQVLVAENLNPGAIARIELFDPQGGRHVVYEDDRRSVPFWPEARMFRHVLDAPTPYAVAGLKLVLRTRRIPGMVQIDAIGVAGHDREVAGPFIREIDDELFGEPAENLGPLVNSVVPDQLPLIAPDGRTLYFARKYHPRNTGGEGRDDIWVAELAADGAWGAPRNVGAPLNNEHHNFAAWISPDGSRMLLPHDYDRAESGNAFRVSMARRRLDRQGWNAPVVQQVPDLYNRSEFTCLHMNPEGTVMLLALEREEGLGGLDLYACFHQGGKRWSAPVHLGPTVNTAGMEGSVHLAADGRTLYFASNGLPGHGGYDMYLSRRLDDSWTRWSEPVGLGPRINTDGDDYYYSLPASGEYAYFATERDSYGGADLYRIRLPRGARPDPITYLEARVLRADRDEPLPARLTTPRAVWTMDTAVGRAVVIAPRSGDSAEAVVVIEARGFFPRILDLEAREPAPEAWMDHPEDEPDPVVPPAAPVDSAFRNVATDIRLVPLAVGHTVRLHGVYFTANQAALRAESRTELDRVADFLRARPGLRVEVGGHTNGLPGAAFCQELSDARAKRVVAYLVEHGVDRDQLEWKGYGKTEPVASNETLEGRQQNQRVELTILRVDPADAGR